MENNAKGRNDQGNQERPNTEMNRTHDDRRLQQSEDMHRAHDLPYEDPAITNPQELASFPKTSKMSNPEDIENESESHLVNRRSPVREGRNITRTYNNPDTNGYM